MEEDMAGERVGVGRKWKIGRRESTGGGERSVRVAVPSRGRRRG
jgi:hypothetical protein